jgi:hypothetical protein
MSPIVGNTSSEGKKPSQPTIGTATATGATSASISFTEPTYKGKSGSVTYTVTSSPGTLTATGTSPVTLTGLTTGTGYTFFVYATTDYGVSSDNSSNSNSITPQVLGANYVADVAASSAYYSSDLNTWTSIPGQNGFSFGTYVNSTFYISGSDGTGSYSTNGTVWTNLTNDAFYQTSISYVNSRFVARGPGRLVYTSTDFINWTQRTGSINYPMTPSPAIYFGSRYWTHTRFNARLLEWSTDTVTWSSTTINAPNTGYASSFATVFFNTHFYAMAVGPTFNPNLLIRSTDGNAWSTVTTPDFGFFGSGIGTLSASGGRLFINFYDGLFTSTNGTAWTTATVPENARNHLNYSDISNGNGRWAFWAQADDGSSANIFTSTSGTSFTLSSSATSNMPPPQDYGSNSWNHNGIMYGDKFVQSAYAQDFNNWPPTSYCTFRTSTNATTWSSWTTPISRNGNAYGKVYYTNAVYACGASDPENDQFNVLSSTNGITWTKRVGPSNVSFGTLNGAGNNTFIFSGTGNIIHTSTNAVTWTQRSTQITGYWPTWSFGNSRYLATDFFGTGNVVLSTNLTNWSTTTYTGPILPKQAHYKSAANGTIGVFFPDSPQPNNSETYQTTDGVAWTQGVQVGGTWDAYSNAVFGNGVFVIGKPYGANVWRGTNITNMTDVLVDPGYGAGPARIDFTGGKFYGIPYPGNWSGSIVTSTDALTWTFVNTGAQEISLNSYDAFQTKIVAKP